MNDAVTKRNELLAQKVIKGLESRNMSVRQYGWGNERVGDRPSSGGKSGKL